jgi:hypothetical protein
MGDRDRWPEVLTVRVARGTLARIQAALGEGEASAPAFTRTAINRELTERERERRFDRLRTWIV